jgi:hypothetical protein
MNGDNTDKGVAIGFAIVAALIAARLYVGSFDPTWMRPLLLAIMAAPILWLIGLIIQSFIE